MTKAEQIIKFTQMIENPWYRLLFIAVAIWSLIWKGIALWKAAENKSKPWFIALLIVNTIGILEIIYIFFFSKKAGQQDK